MIPEPFKKQAAESGLTVEAYLPPSLAQWVIGLVEQGDFTSPSEAIFVAMQTYQEMEHHPDMKKELLRRMLTEAVQDAEKGNTISHEEVIAELREKALQKTLEPAVWDRSMDRPLFEE